MDPLTIGAFRQDYPEFTNDVDYPDASLTYWLNIATMMLNANRWDENLNMGLELFMAHHLVLEKMSRDTAKVGGWPGLNKGAISGETTNAGSVSYDTNSVIEADAGHWNYTIYGTRFIHLVRMFGAGPIQIGPGCGSATGAWSGPVTGLPWFK
jgi:hypothetical protein